MSAAPATAKFMSLRDWSLLAALSVLWGLTFFFAKIALVEIPPVTLVMSRVWIAAVALLAILKIAGLAVPVSRAAWVAFFGMGLLNNVVPFSLIFLGQSMMPRQIAASMASILNATTPLFAMVVCHFMTRDEKLTPARLAGVLLGLAGVAVMLAPRLLGADTAPGGERMVQGVLSCLAAAVVYAFSALYARRFKSMGIAPLQIAFGQLAASSAMTLPLAALIDQPWTLAMPGPGPLAAVAGLALLSTAVAYVIFFNILATAGATNLMLVTFLVPVSAILLGVTFLGESLGPVHVAGMALIGLGLAVIDGRPARTLFNR